MSKEDKILFVTPYPEGTAGSQRFRFELYYNYLEQNGFQIEKRSFIDQKTWNILYKEGFTFKKIIGILKGFLRRLYLLFSLKPYKYVFIHRESTPLGPPFFEYIAAKWLGKRLIFDFDDAIWRRDTSSTNKIISAFKSPNKVAKICTWAYKISAGNQFLADYATKYNSSVVINPTVVDTLNHHNKAKNQAEESINIGWTGTHTTMKYLEAILPVIEKLEKTNKFTFYVISDKAPDFKLNSLKYLPWNKASEIEDLLKFHIGLMPLEENEWAKGKCGFKAIQYLSLGIPALVTPLGVNKEIVENGVNGFYCQSADDWYNSILQLLANCNERKKMAEKAIKKIQDKYSMSSGQLTFLSMFN